VLYGAFALLRQIALQRPIEAIDVREEPFAPIRILNHWDNLDGTIERGYAGRSIFWENDGLGGHQRLVDQQRERRRARGDAGLFA
jgi:alpha-glucuronidase